MDFAKAIKTIRQTSGLTQTEFAEKVSISQTWLSKLETGAKVPEHQMIEQIAEAFGMPPNFVYVMAMESPEDGQVPELQRELFKKLHPIIGALIKQYLVKLKEEGN